MKIPAAKIVPRGVYAFFHEGKIVYVGSTSISLARVEYNHRNARKKRYSITLFREQLMTTYRGVGSFRWLVEPFRCNQRQIEELEDTHIKFHNPRFNVDKHPVRSSIRYGRYK